jgi:hypothetical protein
VIRGSEEVIVRHRIRVKPLAQHYLSDATDPASCHPLASFHEFCGPRFLMDLAYSELKGRVRLCSSCLSNEILVVTFKDVVFPLFPI